MAEKEKGIEFKASLPPRSDDDDDDEDDEKGGGKGINLETSTVNPFFHTKSHLPFELQHHLKRHEGGELNDGQQSGGKIDIQTATLKTRLNVIAIIIHVAFFFLSPIMILTTNMYSSVPSLFIDKHIVSITYFIISIYVLFQDFSFYYIMETSLRKRHIKKNHVNAR
jgi:hypothetical protein